jgi:hypothetical protein
MRFSRSTRRSVLRDHFTADGAPQLQLSGKPQKEGRKRRLTAIMIGTVLAGGAAFAATNWVVGLTAGSSAQGQSATISNLTIAAVSTPSPTNLLYPGGTGDALIKITNPNAFPVTITALQLPTNAIYAAGYSDAGLTTANATCTATGGSASNVSWNFATGTSGTTHTLTTPLTVAGNGTLTVTLTNDVAMGATSPSSCAGTYFKMPSFVGVTATGGAGTATTSPATDAWTS